VAEYYPVEDVTDDGDGHVLVRMRFTDDAWLIRLVLGLGGKVQVVSPARLRVAVAERAAEALRAVRSR
jgi:proteasome accessory factor C